VLLTQLLQEGATPAGALTAAFHRVDELMADSPGFDTENR
jgi:hypothetical protein